MIIQLAVICIIIFIMLVNFPVLKRREKSNVVLVVGDITRSPRMLYHTLSLSKYIKDLTLVGYQDDRSAEHPILSSLLRENTGFYLSPLYSGIEYLKWVPRMLFLPLKLIFQTITLIFALYQLLPMDMILVQNPPAVPVLVVLAILRRLHLIKFLIIDWHNYGYTLLDFSRSPFMRVYVKIYEFLEFTCAESADKHLCVSESMRNDLIGRLTLDSCYLEFINKETVFLVSSTSWTGFWNIARCADWYLVIYKEYDKMVENENFPNIFCIITGKGEGRDQFMVKYEKANLQHCYIVSTWLSYNTYTKILGYADLGICLHQSSSGLDLPMKALDMLGSGLPVCAFNYPTISELIKDEVNGFLFNDSHQLFSILLKLFECEDSLKISADMRERLCAKRFPTFDSEWKKVVKPFLKL